MERRLYLCSRVHKWVNVIGRDPALCLKSDIIACLVAAEFTGAPNLRSPAAPGDPCPITWIPNDVPYTYRPEITPNFKLAATLDNNDVALESACR
jgi:hypothetical protein